MSEFRQIEEKWQRRWDEEKAFQAEPNPSREKLFVTVPYPYVNGEPHIGHGFTYMRADAYARFKRMQGFNVLLPQGFHATGEPILGVVERVRNGDKDQIDALKNLGATDDDIAQFAKEGPEFVANYWKDRTIEVLKNAGYSVDWRRTFITAITPSYNRFIQWQYNTLKEKGYVVQGTHPVVWCPHDQSPTGDHDRLVGEGESPVEYVMVKFVSDSGEVFPCGTLRPETVYGATNIWMSPQGKYMRAKVDGKDWIIGEAVLHKLMDQMHEVVPGERIDVRKFFGGMVENPVTKAKIPILPAEFVDSDFGTGIVMSVPSHAPYDWMGLHNLKEDADYAKRFGIKQDLLDRVIPISVISVPGMSEHPAIEMSSSMLISSQAETEKLDEATKEVYKREFHQGVLKASTGYSGMKVSEAKDRLIQDFVRDGFADSLWETTGDVVCRCKTKCHVKILENQWFLKFSDEKWKRLVREAVSRMSFHPDIVRTQFMNTIDWLKDKACARKSGLGTKLPWDQDWIVETLSDSVIYMAYYTISHLLEKVHEEKLTDDVFDFVFLGKGSVKEVAKKSKLGETILQNMRGEFEYFYPVDMRFSGKDLVQNHLTYFIFHHTAIWEQSMWPRGIAVNGYVTLGGQKMSKRFGNVTRLRDLLEKYGADVTRLNLVGANENMDDADWKEDSIDAFRSRISTMMDLIDGLKEAERTGHENIDSFLLSRVQKIVKDTTDACEQTKFRSAIQSAMFESSNEIKWYIDRCGSLRECNGKVLREALSTVVRLLTPFMPHLAEEMWEQMGNKSLVSLEDWPKPNAKLIDDRSELGERMVGQVLDDVRQIQKISGITPKKVTIIISPQWKFDVYKLVLENREADFKKILSMLREKNESTVKYIQALQKKQDLSESFLERQEQFEILGQAKVFLESQLSASVVIEDAEKSGIDKAKNADVRKPAILLA